VKKTLLAIAVATALTAISAPVASAEYFIGRGQAQRFTKDAVSERYDVSYYKVVAVCRPQGRSAPEAGYIYHRWTCGFLIRGAQWDNCDDPEHEYYGGGLLIAGHSGAGYYGYKVVRGLHCF
jgi:hypothetical protein